MDCCAVQSGNSFSHHNEFPPRKDEVDGVDYFVSKAEFERLIEAGELLEHAKYIPITKAFQNHRFGKRSRRVKM